MIGARGIIVLAIVWTVTMAGLVQFASPSGAVVIAVAVAWFSLGRALGRGQRPITRWGRRP